MSELTRGTRGAGPVQAGANLYLVGGLLIVTKELARMGSTDLPYSMEAGYVVMAFLGQALLGGGLVMSSERFRTVGWTTVAWNLGLLGVLTASSPADMYFPIAHNVMPSVIAMMIMISMRRIQMESANTQTTPGVSPVEVDSHHNEEPGAKV